MNRSIKLILLLIVSMNFLSISSYSLEFRLQNNIYFYPEVNAKNAIAMDIENEKILYFKNGLYLA